WSLLKNNYMKDVILKLITMPIEINKRNISVYEFLKELQYFKLYNDIKEDDIRNELEQYPDYIKYWMIYSEDKRSSSGWYLLKTNNTYIVDYFPNENQNLEFVNPEAACANFIKKEIEDIRIATDGMEDFFKIIKK
ncbi:MAG: hypothetical protein JWN78_559, partial [Bacteroidota bacterium]|nr:hypothetical protein [Bacteroidota bacterium]